jgi:F420H(2)-dependent quinone reductase
VLDIVLMTTGRKSGEPREARLYAFPDGEQLVVVASGHGKDPEPRWANNLRAQPRASIRRRRSTRSEPVLAREVGEGPERDRLWAVALSSFPYFDAFQRRTSRTLAVFVLEPVEAIER